MAGEAGSVTGYGRAEWRIELFAVSAGMLGTAGIACFLGLAASLSFLFGAVISWLNFRWLKQGVSALVGLAVAQEGAVEPRVPAGVYVKFAGRYLLLLLAAYVILSRLRLPAAYLIAGLFVVVAAVLLELVLELFGVVPAAEIAKTLRQD